jgi:hypothetical protein
LQRDRQCSFVITGLDPAIHAFTRASGRVDGRIKSGHDQFG